MKLLCRIFFLFQLTGLASPAFLGAQTGNSIYRLKEKIRRFEQQQNYFHDTAYANALVDLGYEYSSGYPDSALLILKGNAERCHESGYGEGEVSTYIVMGDAFQTKGNYEKALEYYEKSFQLAKKIKYLKVLSLVLNRIGIIHLNQGNYPDALSKFYESLKDAEAINDKDLAGATLNNIAIVHFYQGKFDEAESAYKERLKIAQDMSDSNGMSVAYNGIGEVSLQQKDPVKALHNLALAYDVALKINDQQMRLTVMLSMAEAYFVSDSLQKSVSLFENALQLSRQADQGTSICNALIGLAKARHRQGLFKEALANGLEGLQRAEKMGQVQLMRDANEIVSVIYEALGEGSNALKYYRNYKLYSDSLNNMASQRAVAIEKASYEYSKKELAFQRKTLQQRWLIFSAFVALLIACIIVWIINRNRKKLNHANKNLHQKNLLIEAEKSKVEETLSKLKAAQTQLIQSEKMASLGELTAGIAHEIQNPLNFVNNFSEVNSELIDELTNELQSGNNKEAILIAEDIKENEQKINHHGRRADAIVKGMLQHSRQTKGQKEPTDINALTDEYLRLCYHGLRAKDKTFNAAIQTDFDKGIGLVNIIPQDIGRVLLNLFTNAFYAVNEKKKQSVQHAGGQSSYEPKVSVTTKSFATPSKDLEVVISIKDNGNGISEKIIDKIFQPFFTTKPTGDGTGLGLSLSYDIIKAHGGEIKVETKEGEGSTFIIQLPKLQT